MALTVEEMDLEAAEYVPAREVMCTVWYQPPCHGEGGGFQSPNQETGGAYAFGNGLIAGNNVLSGDNLSVNIL